MKLVKKNTKWERHSLSADSVIYVKREDLCCSSPGPPFSKIRGIESVIHEKLGSLLPPERYGVVDSVHSQAGWGVSYICSQLGIPCTVFYPKLKAEPEGHLRSFQQKCLELGAELIPIPATKSSVLFYKARRIFYEKYSQGYLFPNGLKLEQTIGETAEEVQTAPKELLADSATWVVSVSSGTIAAGVVKGLSLLGFAGTVVLHMGFSRSVDGLLSYVLKYAPDAKMKIEIIDEGYAYKDSVSFSAPFPCNPYYDRKAWKWLVGATGTLSAPLVFWNIGG